MKLRIFVIPRLPKNATAKTIEAEIVATKLSNRSEQLPAISFTLSPIKSAITFGTRLSSSGKSLRILPKISAEISAALV